jgi:uncharacterized BrkB/YihY/UPF0761 family membrane protein
MAAEAPQGTQSAGVEGPGAHEGRLARWRHRAEALKDRSQRQLGAARDRHSSVDFVLATGERDRILGGSLVAGAIAFRMFLLVVPMMVVVVAIASLVTNVSSLSSQQLVAKLGMVGYIADSVADATKMSSGSAWTVLIVALWILLLTARSFARALRTAHALAWGQPIRRWPHGLKAGFAVIGLLTALLLLAGTMNSMRGESVISSIGVAIGTGIGVGALWMLASRFLPHAGDRWLDLLPGALLVGVGAQLVNVAVIYFTWRATRAEAFYGPLGLSIVLLVWLYIMGRLLITSAVLNAQRYARRTGITSVPTVLTATDDAVAGVDAGAELSGPGTTTMAAAFSGQAAVTLSAQPDSEEPAMNEEKAAEEKVEARTDEAKTDEAKTDEAKTDEAGAAEDKTAEDKSAEETPAGQTSVDAAVAAEIVDKGAAPPEPPKKKVKKPGRGRRITALTLVILAAIVSIIMMVSVWAHDFLLNTDTFVTTVAPVLKDPQVTQSMGELVAQRTIELTDAEQRLEDVLPERLKFVAAPIVGQVEQQLAKGTTKLLRSDKGYAAWEKILTFTHKSVVAVLQDESKYLNIHGDQIRLDLLPLVVAAVNRLNELLPDVIAQRAPLPEFTADQTPEEQRAALAEALGKPVSEDFAQVTVFEGEQVQTAQKALKLFNLLVYALIALTVILVIAAIIVSPRRLRTLIHLGIAAVIAVIITRIAVNQVQGAILDTASGTNAQPVIKASVTAVFGSLQSLIIWGLVAGAVVGVLAYLATKPRWLMRLGAHLVVWAKALGAWGKSAGGQAAEHRDPALDWTRAHKDGLLIGITVLAVVLLLFFTSSLGGAIAIIVVAALLGGGVYWVGRTPPGTGPTDGEEGPDGPAGDKSEDGGTPVDSPAGGTPTDPAGGKGTPTAKRTPAKRRSTAKEKGTTA